ncbi:NADase-type glycan-binding domain-containing protein [Actinomadura sp. 3N508]|uniref:NADase-type glycan-binding domain-containing protein n=1 Tax=Actinomadura sp. 3N508 TaxID=3375153 RepID=UPI00379DEA27
MTSTGVCVDCGATGQGGSFCDRCGAVLNWTPPRGTPRPAPAEQRSEQRPGRPGTPGGRPVPPPDVPQDRRVAPLPQNPPPAQEPPPAQGRPPAQEGPPAWGEPPPAQDERARRLLIPVAPENRPAPVPQGPTPVLPGRPEAARPHVRTGRADMSGGVPCPWCDTPNPPGRHFCRQCAMRLTAAGKDGFRTRTWWQRIFHGERDGEAPWAEERPRLRRGPGNLLTVVALVMAGVALAVTVAVKADDVAGGVVDHFVKRAPVPPNGTTASHSDPNHGPKLAMDGLSNTFWGTGLGGGGQGAFLEASFSQPRRLLNVIITSGISKQPDQYATQGRPQILDATVFSSDGKSRTTALRLDDAPGPQKLKLRGDNAVRVRLTIRSAYGAAPDRQVCIAEVEFFTRSTVKTL